MPSLIALACALVLIGCGGDDEPAGENEVAAFATELEGIYELTELELNLDGCEPAGANVISDGFLALYTTSARGFSGFKVISCADIASCQTKVQDILAPRSVSYNFHLAFDEQVNDSTAAGSETIALQAGDSCQLVVTDAVLERTADMQIEIESQHWHGDEYETNAEGFCALSEGPEPELDEPCNEFRSMTGERVADL
jgi:hypothetical protein